MTFGRLDGCYFHSQPILFSLHYLLSLFLFFFFFSLLSPPLLLFLFFFFFFIGRQENCLRKQQHQSSRISLLNFVFVGNSYTFFFFFLLAPQGHQYFSYKYQDTTQREFGDMSNSSPLCTDLPSATEEYCDVEALRMLSRLVQQQPQSLKLSSSGVCAAPPLHMDSAVYRAASSTSLHPTAIAALRQVSLSIKRQKRILAALEGESRDRCSSHAVINGEAAEGDDTNSKIPHYLKSRGSSANSRTVKTHHNATATRGTDGSAKALRRVAEAVTKARRQREEELAWLDSQLEARRQREVEFQSKGAIGHHRVGSAPPR